MTLVIAAKCADGVAIICDTVISNRKGEIIRFGEKIFGTLEHVVYGFAGTTALFDAFDNWAYADVHKSLGKATQYTYGTVVPRLSSIVKELNEVAKRSDNSFSMLVSIHFSEAQLYHIPPSGVYSQLDYRAIGSGTSIADDHLSSLSVKTMTVEEFTIEACAVILHVEEIDKGLPLSRKFGIGFGTAKPMVRWLKNGEKWDIEPTDDQLKAIMEKANTKAAEYNTRRCH